MASAESTDPRDDDPGPPWRRTNEFRPIQFWVPDVQSDEFKREAHRQALAVANCARAADDQSFVESVADFFDE